MTLPRRHTLVVYRASEVADRRLRELAARIGDGHGRLTVVALAARESTDRRCCDTRSVMWNSFTREFASDELARARAVLHDAQNVDFALVVHPSRGAADALADQARARSADEIVLADSKSGLTRRERRKLRKLHPVQASG